MKYLSALLVLFSLHLSMPAHADWDPVGEARAKAEGEKASAERKALEKRMHANTIREDNKKLGIDSSEKSDDQVIQEHEARIQKQGDEINKIRAKGVSDMRKALGKEADGKSDDQVTALYSAKMERDSTALMKKVEADRPKLEAGVKDMTGHSMDDMSNMSDEDLDKLEKQMEQKYGQ